MLTHGYVLLLRRILSLEIDGHAHAQVYRIHFLIVFHQKSLLLLSAPEDHVLGADHLLVGQVVLE
jgi:hypothetical protein